jgi:hypothetical protein
MAATTQVVGVSGTEQQWLASVTIDGVPYGNFDKFAGGDSTSTPSKYRPGGMGPEKSLVALPVFSDITVSKVYETVLDHQRIADLHNGNANAGILGAGKSQAVCSLQPLDDSGTPWGNARVYTGRLATVKDGSTDSMSNSPRMWEIDIVVETISG